jgi:hypothetical protein
MERETRVGTRDVQLGKTTINWKQRTLRFLHLFLAIENNPVFTLGFGPVLNGAQTEHRPSTLRSIQKTIAAELL